MSLLWSGWRFRSRGLVELVDPDPDNYRDYQEVELVKLGSFSYKFHLVDNPLSGKEGWDGIGSVDDFKSCSTYASCK